MFEASLNRKVQTFLQANLADWNVVIKTCQLWQPVLLCANLGIQSWKT